MRRFVVGAALTVSFALAFAGTASAWYAHGSSYRNGAHGVVEVVTEPGEQLDVVASWEPDEGSVVPISPYPLAMSSVTLRDSSTPVTAPPAGRGAACTKLDDYALRCKGWSAWGPEPHTIAVDYLSLDLGDGHDRVTIRPTSVNLFTIGDMGAGNDTLDVHNLSGAYIGLGDGDDRVTLRGSQGGYGPWDGVYGDAGNDVLRLANLANDDNPVCGDGGDVLYVDEGEPYDPDCETVHVFGRLP